MKIPTLPEIITIEEILIDANAHDLRIEVRETAEKIWSEKRDEEEFTLLDAYHLAYHEWVK